MFFIVSVSSLTWLNHFQRRNRQTEGERLATQAKDQAWRAEVALLSLFLYLPCTHTTKKCFQERDQETEDARLARLAGQMARQARV